MRNTLWVLHLGKQPHLHIYSLNIKLFVSSFQLKCCGTDVTGAGQTFRRIYGPGYAQRANWGGFLGFSTQIPRRLTTTEKHGILQKVALKFLPLILGVRRGPRVLCQWPQRMAGSGICRRKESGIGDTGKIQGRHPAGRHVIEEQRHGTEDLRSRRLAVNMN